MPHPTHRAQKPHPSPRLGLAVAAVVALCAATSVGSAAVAAGPSGHSDHGKGEHGKGDGKANHGTKGVHVDLGVTVSKPKHDDGDQDCATSTTKPGTKPTTTPTTGPVTKPGGSADDCDTTTDDNDGGLLNDDPSETLPTSIRPGVGLLSALAPTPAPLTAYEMPFPCGETWTATTRANHTPSPRALDWNAPGDLGKPVVAAAAGTVTTAITGTNLASYGQYVVIDHGNGESTLYGHLNSVLVTTGQTIAQGQQLGTLGSTGNSTGPHLHFEERLNGTDQDVWLHGAPFAPNTSGVSANCGGATTTTTTTTSTVIPVSVRQVPMAGNMYGARPAETIVYKLRAHSYFEVTRTGKPTRRVAMGDAGDQPVIGDWDGNGRVNPGVRRPGSRTFFLRVHGSDQRIRFGQTHDLPIAGNWDGSGGWEIGVRKAKSGTFKLRSATGAVTKVHLGDADDIPVTGDWNGDGRTDLGVYDSASAVFTLQWTDVAGVTWQTQSAVGVPGDFPVAGDWDGNGTTDLGAWDPRTRTIIKDGATTTVSANAVAGRGHLRRTHAHLIAPRSTGRQ